MVWILIRIASPCCGYSLELPWRDVSNVPTSLQRMFLCRNKQNYPLIITKYPPLYNTIQKHSERESY